MTVHKDDAVLAFKHILKQIIDSRFDMSLDWVKSYENELNRIDFDRLFDD